MKNSHGLAAALIAVALWCGGTVLLAEDLTTVYLSDLDISQMRQALGSPGRDKSVENKPISIGGHTFQKGIGTHAESSWELELKPGARKFAAAVGVHDETGKNGSVEFLVYGDTNLLWSSGVMRGGEQVKLVDLDISPYKRLLLHVTDGSDGSRYDHAVWADAKVLVKGEATAVAVAAPEPAVILTPKPGPEPRINGAKVVGARPGSPFMFTIPATGERRMIFDAKGLPSGLAVDGQTGCINGSVAKAGTYNVTLKAKNARGTASRDLKIIVGEQIALTPPMGWNSWNCWGCDANDARVCAVADGFTSLGLINHGWTYVNLDDGWQSMQEHADGGPGRFPPAYALQADKGKFPDIKMTSRYVHLRGLKMGLYSTPWKSSNGNYTGGSADDDKGHRDNQKVEGRVMFEFQDSKQWAEWGIDYLKYDWSPVDVDNAKRMADALRVCGRDIVYSLSGGVSREKARQWAGLANMWRTAGDITDMWESMSGIGFSQDPWKEFAGPGHWNDPGMLVVGHVGWGKPRPSRLTPNEQYTHITLWCLLSAPLLLGCDVSRMDDFTVSLLSNDEVLEVDQDPLGMAAGRVSKDGDCEVWAKKMEDGSRAVGLFNRGLFPAKVTARWVEMGLSGPQKVRDLWRQKDVGEFKDQFDPVVPRHGCMMIRVWPKKG